MTVIKDSNKILGVTTKGKIVVVTKRFDTYHAYFVETYVSGQYKEHKASELYKSSKIQKHCSFDKFFEFIKTQNLIITNIVCDDIFDGEYDIVEENHHLNIKELEEIKKDIIKRDDREPKTSFNKKLYDEVLWGLNQEFSDCYGID